MAPAPSLDELAASAARFRLCSPASTAMKAVWTPTVNKRSSPPALLTSSVDVVRSNEHFTRGGLPQLLRICLLEAAHALLTGDRGGDEVDVVVPGCEACEAGACHMVRAARAAQAEASAQPAGTGDAVTQSIAAAAGIGYAAAAVVANLALHREGAEQIADAGVLRALLPLLVGVRGAVSMPSVAWLFTRKRTLLCNASTGGGAARAMLNSAYASRRCARELVGLQVVQTLKGLAASASANVRGIAERAVAFLFDVEVETPRLVGEPSTAASDCVPHDRASPSAEVSTVPTATAAAANGKKSRSSKTADSSKSVRSGRRRDSGTGDGKRKRRKVVKRPRAGAAPSTCEFERILARRLRGDSAEYLVKWRDPRDGAATWEPVHHIHDPLTVAAFERGAASAAMYEEWAWWNDARGAGWACVPLPVNNAQKSGAPASSGARCTQLGSSAACELPPLWPHFATYSPFLIWGDVASSTSRLRSARWHRLAGVEVRRLPPSHPANTCSRQYERARSRSEHPKASGGANCSEQPAAYLDRDSLCDQRAACDSGNCTNRARRKCAGGSELHAKASAESVVTSCETRKRGCERECCSSCSAGACGLFAACDVPCGALLGDFTGVVKPQQKEDPSQYLLELLYDETVGVRFDIDAEYFGNETRFINDYHGIKPSPNVHFVLYNHPVSGDLAVGVVTRRLVRRGEEILVDYGRAFWESESDLPVVSKSPVHAKSMAASSATNVGAPASCAAASHTDEVGTS